MSDLSQRSSLEEHSLLAATLAEWNNTTVEYPTHLRLHEQFEAAAERSPSAIAVVFGQTTLTYGELNQRANQLAHYLQGRGVQPEVPVGICIERSLEMIVGLLAILKAGGAYVPLDPTYPVDRLAHILSDSQIKVVLTQTKLLLLLRPESALEEMPSIEAICLDGDWEAIAQQPATTPACPATSTNLAYIIYTSGSTGKPKGVLIEHQGAVNTILDVNQRFQVGPGDGLLAVCSLNFDLSVYDVFGLLGAGGTIVLPQPAIAPDLNEWIDLMTREQVTIWNSAPPVMQMFAGHLEDHDRRLPASLRVVMLSGDWIPTTLPDTIRRLRVGDGPLELMSLGGATEASIWSIWFPITAVDPTWKSIPYGKPMANQRFHILDEQLQPVAIGAVGELFIAGDGVARGYHNRPDLNATKFLPDPFHPQPRAQLYRTGDLGRYLPDGNIEFLGRIDHQVKIRGFRVELGEIEATLLQHPVVREAAVLAQGEAAEKQLVAYIVPRLQQDEAEENDRPHLVPQLRALLKEKLPSYMLPAAFVLLEALPLTPNGKLDRQALPAPELIQAPVVPNATPAPASDAMEERLVELWQEALGVRPIGIHDNFFDLGGHSLLAARLWSQIEAAFQIQRPLATLFQAPTIAELADRLRQSEPVHPSTVLFKLQPGQPAKKRPLFCLHVLGEGCSYYRPLVAHLDSDYPVYGLAAQMLDEANAPRNQVESLADYYIQEIQALQPEGPYYLLGVSFGGDVAFEVARRLAAQGQKTALVGLMDTYGPGETGKLNRDRLFVHLKNLLAAGPTYLLQKASHRLETKLVLLVHWLGAKCYRLLKWLKLPAPFFLQVADVRNANIKAAEIYVPRPYEGRVTLFRATDEVFYSPAYLHSGLGWKPLALGGLDIEDVPGDHLGMLAEPHARVLAEKLQRCIDRVESSESAPSSPAP